jgi:mRNA interferase RelE/StbE
MSALPGNIRQRIRRAINALSLTPRPFNSLPLAIPTPTEEEGLEVRRLRLANWRIVYVIDQSRNALTVLAIRKRPPYRYDDLEALLTRRS